MKNLIKIFVRKMPKGQPGLEVVAPKAGILKFGMTLGDVKQVQMSLAKQGKASQVIPLDKTHGE